MAAGATISQIVAAALPGVPGPLLDRLRVTIDGQVYLPGFWSKVRPKPGTVVIVRAVPGDSGVLRNVLLVAISIAAVAAGQFYGPLLAGSLLGLPGAAAAGTLPSLISAGITGTAVFAGALLVNALIPPPSNPRDRPAYSLQGPRNNTTPDGVVPMLLGRMRVFPPYAMLPFTEAVGADRFATAVFVLSYGPIAISDPRIGDTPLARFRNVQRETRQGYPGDARLALAPTTVIEKPLAIALLTLAAGVSGGPQVRTTASNASRYSVDITFPSGLYSLNKDNEREPWTVEFTHRYRAAGETTWTNAPNIVITAKDARPVVRTIPQVAPAVGRYEVEINRLTTDWDEADQSKRDRQVTSSSSWTVIRSFRPEYPIAFEHPLAVEGLRLQATRQLNGVPDEYNVIGCTICPDWDPPTQTWIERETNNPASLFRHVLTCSANAHRIEDEDDIASLGAWHENCVANGLTYNRYIDFETSLGDVLSEVAAAGRASPHHTGEKWSVVVDRVIEQVTAHVTPRNSWGFEGEHRFQDLPDALVINFQDETNLWEKAQRTVPRPGLVGPPKRLEKFDMPGVTNPTMIYREATRRFYELMLRPNTYWAMQGHENFGTQRGDRAELSHDVIDHTFVSARVQGLLPPDGDPKAILLDEPVTMEEGRSYAVRFRRDDGMSLLRSLRTKPGSDRVIELDGIGDAPQVGNLAMVGLASRATKSCIVKGVEAMAKMQARLTLIDRAPEIDTLVDATPIPLWSGLAGGPAQEPTDPPLQPIVTSILSGRGSQALATVLSPYPVAVMLQADPADRILLAAFEVRHRMQGASVWSSAASAAAAAGTVLLPGYAKGNAIEFQPRAVSLSGIPSPWGATVAHVVAATDAPVPVNLAVTIERRVVSGQISAAFLRLTCDPITRTDLGLVGRYRKVGTSAWLPIPRSATSLSSILSDVLTDGDAFEVQGATATAGGADTSDYIAAAGSPITATADPVAPAAPTFLSTARVASTNTVNHSGRLPNSANARSMRLTRARGFGKVFADGSVVDTQAGAPNATLALSDTIDLGLYRYWLTAANGSGVVSVPAGPNEILAPRQLNNLLTAPDDMTNAAWTKSDVTPTLSGTGPDGVTMTQLLEGTGSGSHRVQQAITFSGGATSGRVRYAQGIKASGRTRARLYIFDAAGGSNYVYAAINLAAGTIGSPVYSGSGVTLGAVEIERVASDVYLATLTATVASTGCQVRLYLCDDTGTTVYAGDTSKGLYAWAASLALVA